jgi:putative PIN family toxin of toxin-antitoxin system
VTSAVVDPSVFVSAFIGRPDAGPGRVVSAWRDGRFTLISSPLMLEELGDVLGRPKFERWAGDGRAAAFIAALATQSDQYSDPEAAPSGVRDPNDEYLVALARLTAADALVSLDLDLLEAPLDDLTICTPFEFLTRLDAAPSR